MEKTLNSKPRVLVVNDDPMQLRLLAKFLEKDGKEVITCMGGEEALSKLRELKAVDLIVTDLYMPGIDGWKLCRLLRSVEFSSFNQTPILVISATFRGIDTEEITRELGANGFLSVPYNPEDLKCAIANILLGKTDERKSRILIVEDDKNLRETLREGFKECGCLVYEASDGKQARSLFEEVKPDTVILDYHLPEYNGGKLLESFKSPQSHAAVLVITGDPNPDLAIKVTQKGADAYIRKPFKIKYIIDLCEKVHREWSLLRVETLLENRTLELRRMLETSVDGIMISDASDCIVQVNSATELMLGYSRDVIVGKHIGELMPQDQANHDKTMIMISDLKKKGKISGIEHVWKRKDGTLLHVELNLSMVKDVKGNQTGSLVCIRDITYKKKAETELKEAKDFLEKVIETIGDGLLICDDKGQILSTNSSLEKMYGYERAELIGQHTSIFTMVEKKELRKEIHERIAELFEKGNVSYESIFKRKDGRLVEVECNNSMLKDDDGNYIAGVSIFRDISERKKAAREIKEAKEFLESVIGNSQDGILITDMQGTIISANTAMAKMTGVKKEELVGKHPSMFVVEDATMKKKMVEKVPELFEKGFISYETIHKSTNGIHINVECTCSLIKDDQGNPIAGVSIIRDVTERKKMEELLLQSEKLKSLGELAGGVAHNFNNLLAIILGRTQLLKKTTETPPDKEERQKFMQELRKSLEIIEKASYDGVDCVRKVQDFSQKKDDAKNFTDVDLNELIDRTLELTKMKWQDEAESKGIKIYIEKEFSSLSSIIGSPSELEKVYINLITNALDAMPQGGRIRIRTFMDNSDVVSIVEDTGMGIPGDIQDKIFEPFFTTKGVQSRGLGMSASYGIINHHRGTISLESIEGKGTSFTLRLPIVEKTTEEEKLKPVSGKREKARILVVEDEEAVRELLKDILADSGYEVEIAANGFEGVELFKGKEFDLVFTDLGMPGMSGWQVAEVIKGISKKVPVALITGWDVALKETELKEKGVDLIAYKPLGIKKVCRLAEEGMRLRSQFAAA